MPDGGLLGSLGEAIGAAGSQAGKLLSCYVRARTGAGPWNYTLVPFSTGVNLPAPIFFTGAAAGVAVSQSQGTVTARVTLGPPGSNTIALTIDINIDVNEVAGLPTPRAELVLSPDRPVVGDPPPARLSAIALALGPPPLPAHVRLTATLPTAPDGLSSTTTVALEVEPSGRPLTAWLTDAPAVKRTAYFGTSAGFAALPPELKSALSVAGITFPLPIPDPALTLKTTSGAYTVETDSPSTGSRIDLDLSGAASVVDLGAVVTTPWSVPARPAVTASAPTPDPARAYRYLAAVLRPDGSESPPGATSTPVSAAVGSIANLTAPPAPSVGAFSKWRLYRQRRTLAGWSRPVPVVDVGAGATHADTIPTDSALEEAEGSTTPPIPTSLDLQWGTPATPVSPAPLALPLTVRGYDETLLLDPADPDTILALTGLALPASGTASLHPNRGIATPLTFAWQASPTPLTIDYDQPRSKTDVHLKLAPLPTVKAAADLDVADLARVTWSASQPTSISGHLRLPPVIAAEDLATSLPARTSVAIRSVAEKQGGYPVDALALGWVADSVASLQLRLALTDTKKNTTTGTAVVAKELPQSLAAVVVLAHTGDPALVPDPPKHADDAALRVLAGAWSNGPAPAATPTAQPEVSAAGAGTIGQLLLRVQPGAVAKLPGPGPGPGLVAAVEQLASGGTSVRLRVDGLRSFSLTRPAGEAAAFDVRGELSAPQSARVALTSISDEPIELPVKPGGPVEQRAAKVEVRARRIGWPLHVGVGLVSVGRDHGRYDQGDPGDRPGEFRVTVHDDSAAMEGLAVAVSSGKHGEAPASTLVARVGGASAGSSLEVLPVPGRTSLDPPLFSWRQSGGTRVRARLKGGGRLLLTQSQTKGAPIADVDATVPEEVTLALGGDVGTLEAGSDQTKVVAGGAGPPFPQDWVDRIVFWHRGRGTITGVSGKEMAITNVSGDKPDPSLPPVLRWFRVGTPGESGGVRVDAGGGVLAARVGAVTEGSPAAALRAVTAGPKIRLEQVDDVMTRVTGPGGEDRRGAVAALAARVRARTAQLSGWTGARAHERLRGSTFRPAAGDVFRELGALRWTHAALELDPARTNRSFNLTGRVSSPVHVRDAIRLRLRDTPDAPIVLIGPDTTELTAERAYGPGAVRAEGAQWARTASHGEVGYTSGRLEQVPPYLLLVSGWRTPELQNELDDGDYNATVTFGALTMRRWARDVARIVAGGGDLRLGRVSSVGWSSVGADKDGDPETPWADTGDWRWGLSDLWFLTLKPNAGARAEVLIHSLAEVEPDAGSGLQVNVANGQLTARALSVDLGEHAPSAARRAVAEVSAWKHELKAELQMLDVEGSFAVGPEVGLDWDPFRPYQDDETTDDSQWWVASWGYVFGWPVQFGSDGFSGQFDAPWDPYWS